MNNGFFSFPGIVDTRFIEAVQFDTTGIYYIPAKARTLLIYAIGGGGGGGGGFRGASLGNASGGGGGSGGSWTLYRLFLDEFINFSGNNASSAYSFSALQIAIGAGGGGGNGSASDGGAATAGSTGGTTTVSFLSSRGNIVFVIGGLGGGAGTATAPAGGAARIAATWGYNTVSAMGGVGGSGSTSKPSNVSVGHPQQTQILWNGGGGGGGFINSSGLAAAGADITLYNATAFTNFGTPGLARSTTIATGGTTAGVAGQNAPFFNICGKLSPGFGGAGGGGSSLGGASNGGVGYRGGGGGGGGGSKSGVTSGNGGNGGNGYVCIVAFE